MIFPCEITTISSGNKCCLFLFKIINHIYVFLSFCTVYLHETNIHELYIKLSDTKYPCVQLCLENADLKVHEILRMTICHDMYWCIHLKTTRNVYIGVLLIIVIFYLGHSLCCKEW